MEITRGKRSGSSMALDSPYGASSIYATTMQNTSWRSSSLKSENEAPEIGCEFVRHLAIDVANGCGLMANATNLVRG